MIEKKKEYSLYAIKVILNERPEESFLIEIDDDLLLTYPSYDEAHDALYSSSCPVPGMPRRVLDGAFGSYYYEIVKMKLVE